MRKAAFHFTEQIVYFDASDYQAQIAALSPSRRVPLLIDVGFKIWDSLSICEYVAEKTGRGLPSDRLARARARSVAAEMHSGFQALRNECPMNVRARDRRVPLTLELRSDVARIDEIWSGCREEYGAAGNWLFGDFSIADAMFAPVVFRFQTYGAALSRASQRYLSHALQDPTCAPGKTRRRKKVTRCSKSTGSAALIRCEYNSPISPLREPPCPSNA